MAAQVNEFIGGLINEVKIPLQSFCLKEGGWAYFRDGRIMEDLRYFLLSLFIIISGCLVERERERTCFGNKAESISRHTTHV